jgi:hypothetical protein
VRVAAAAHGQLDPGWPWFFSVAVIALWMLAVVGAGALILRRSVLHRDRRRPRRPRRPVGTELALGEGDRALPPGD